MKPLISVIVPCFNQGQFLSEALTSVFDQTYTKWECLIIDDGSTDDTEAVAKRWCASDSRFHYFKKKNGGLSSARNLGLVKSKGNFIQFLDADDFLDINKFHHSTEEIFTRQEENSFIVVTDYYTHDDRTKKNYPPYCTLGMENLTYDSVLFNWDEAFSIPIHAALFESRLIRDFRFPEDLKAKEDWVMWVLLLQKQPCFIYIDQRLAFYRKHGSSMTMSVNIFEEHMRALTYIKKHISPGDYQKLLENMVHRYYKASLRFKTELYTFQRSKVYRLNRILLKINRKIKRLSGRR